jgi:hypothetical protein
LPQLQEFVRCGDFHPVIPAIQKRGSTLPQN